MDQRIIRLYDEYTHKPLTRKNFIAKMIQLSGSFTAAMSLISLLENDNSKAITDPDLSGIVTENVSWNIDGGKMLGYLAKPESDNNLPALVIIHENRGLNEHIKDVTRRAAQEGFIALAPDGLSLLGGTPENDDDARALFSKLDNNQNTLNFVSAVDYLKSRKDCNGRIGCVGFCWGGAMSNQLAVHAENLSAAVSFYGRQPEKEDIIKINVPLQLHYGENDERINAGIADFESGLKSNNKKYEIYIYAGAGHAFHNNTSAARYNADAAKLAWERTIEFFKKYL
ncbi:MAG: dienelactone hydrolase family protein [Saprospiraceae bacterium]|jgi:carboxymethylenebutenolidase|nr:dienelactone hydrolase family protein [Saprospiraceae bacterium]